MDDVELEGLLSNAISGNLNVDDLGEPKFFALLDGLARMYFARVFNCVDPTARYDKEWLMLHTLLKRAKFICERA